MRFFFLSLFSCTYFRFWFFFCFVMLKRLDLSNCQQQESVVLFHVCHIRLDDGEHFFI